MRYLILVLISLVLVGCGRDPEIHPVVDRRLKDLVGRCQELLQVDLSRISVGFERLKNGVQAVCSVSGEYRTIEVNSDIWESLTPTKQLETMLHEFGHCALFKPHKDGVLDGGCPISLMSTYSFKDESCLTTYFEYYITELRRK